MLCGLAGRPGGEVNETIRRYPSALLSFSLPRLRQPTTRKTPVLLPLSMHLIQLKFVSTRHKVIGQERVPFHQHFVFACACCYPCPTPDPTAAPTHGRFPLHGSSRFFAARAACCVCVCVVCERGVCAGVDFLSRCPSVFCGGLASRVSLKKRICHCVCFTRGLVFKV